MDTVPNGRIPVSRRGKWKIIEHGTVCVRKCHAKKCTKVPEKKDETLMLCYVPPINVDITVVIYHGTSGICLGNVFTLVGCSYTSLP